MLIRLGDHFCAGITFAAVQGNILAVFLTQIKNTQRVASFQDTQKIVRYDMSHVKLFSWHYRIVENGGD